MEGRFVRHYGAAAWHEEGRLTRDGVTPFGLFWYRYRAIAPNMAFERLSEARAIGHALAQAFNKDTSRVPESVSADQRDAFVAEG